MSGRRTKRKGKLAFGDKQALRKQKKAAKRAVRAAHRGFDPWHVNEELMSLVGSAGDMLVSACPSPCPYTLAW